MEAALSGTGQTTQEHDHAAEASVGFDPVEAAVLARRVAELEDDVDQHGAHEDLHVKGVHGRVAQAQPRNAHHRLFGRLSDNAVVDRQANHRHRRGGAHQLPHQNENGFR